MESIKQTKDLLNKKLLNNDINIVDIIMGYITEKCECCNEVNFIEDLDVIVIPKKILWNDEKCDIHPPTKDEIPDKLFCEECINKECCKSCDDYCCEGCDNRTECDYQYCDNIFCEDCQDDLLWCSQCESKFCCRKVYKTYDDDGNCIYSCEDCIEVIHPLH